MASDPPRDPPGDPGSTPVTPAALRAYLNAPDVAAHLRAMVMRRVPRQVVDDVRNDAIVKMCATTSLPITAALGGWVETTTLSAVADYIRSKGRRGGREIGEDDIDERAAPVPEPPRDRTEWLRKRVKKSRIDAETLAILEVQAEADLTRAQVAARYGMTEDALKKRVQRFRAKYEDEWKRERTWIWLLRVLVGTVVAVAIAGAIVYARRARPPLPIGPEPVPSASAAPSAAPTDDDRRNIAAPTDGGPSEEKPRK